MRTYFFIVVGALAIIMLVSPFLPERPEPAPKTGVERGQDGTAQEEAPLVTATKAAMRKVGQIYKDSAPWRAVAGAMIKDVYNVVVPFCALVIASPVLLVSTCISQSTWL